MERIQVGVVLKSSPLQPDTETIVSMHSKLDATKTPRVRFDTGTDFPMACSYEGELCGSDSPDGPGGTDEGEVAGLGSLPSYITHMIYVKYKIYFIGNIS